MLGHCYMLQQPANRIITCVNKHLFPVYSPPVLSKMVLPAPPFPFSKTFVEGHKERDDLGDQRWWGCGHTLPSSIEFSQKGALYQPTFQYSERNLMMEKLDMP